MKLPDTKPVFVVVFWTPHEPTAERVRVAPPPPPAVVSSTDVRLPFAPGPVVTN